MRYESNRNNKIDGTRPNQAGNTVREKKGKQTEGNGQKLGSKGHRKVQKIYTSYIYKIRQTKTKETNKRQQHNKRRARITYSSAGYARKV